MNDRDEPNLSPEDSISDEISERVRSVIAAAEGAATAIRHEAEQQVQIKRRAAEAERQRYLEDAKGEAEALLTERMKRISELSDSIIEGAEAILMRIEGAEEAKRQLETMVHALAAAAADLAAESDHGREPPRPRPVALDDNPPPRMRAVPDPAAAEPDPAAVTELHVPQSSTATGADSPAADAGAEPVPDAEPAVTEAEAPAAADDHGPAEPADLEPVDVLPEAEVADEEEVEVVDAVEVTDEEPEKRSAVERLRDAVQGVGGGNGAEAEAAGSEPEPEPERPQPQRAFDGDDMLAARLVALQMAVAGSARDEVEDHLRKAFSLDEPGTILNDVFGTESKL